MLRTNSGPTHPRQRRRVSAFAEAQGADDLADDLRLLVAVGLIKPVSGHGPAKRYALTELRRRSDACNGADAL
jgi:hypothetical protein